MNALAACISTLVLVACGAAPGEPWPSRPTQAPSRDIPGESPTEFPPEYEDASFITKVVGGRPVVSDTRDSTPIIVAAGPPIVGEQRDKDSIVPRVDVIPTPEGDGYDLRVFVENTTDRSRGIGPIRVGAMQLGRMVDVPDMRWGGRSNPTDATRPNPEVYAYPGDLYAPVSALLNDRYAIGVSVLYPIEAYRHDVAINVTSPDWMNRGRGPEDRLWAVFIRFTRPDANSEILQYDAVVAPGESREYTIAVRVGDAGAGWLPLLEPYAAHFRRSFGDVKYDRDPRPVRALALANVPSQTAGNPDGWRGEYRVDVLGWDPVVRAILDEPYARVMLWSPSGLYRSGENYPFQFASRWLDDPEVATATDPVRGLPRVGRAGRDLGLWWGNAARYAATWDPEEQPALDPSNPVHRAAALRELDLAVDAGATSIGLDAMSHKRIPMWDQLAWLRTLQSRAPGVKLVVEPRTCDFIHNAFPMYVRGYGVARVVRTPADKTNIRAPHYLADLLNPGHETWAAMRWDPGVRNGERVGVVERLADARRAAAMGYVPLVFSVVPNDGSLRAKKSWERTIPDSLVDSAGELRER